MLNKNTLIALVFTIILTAFITHIVSTKYTNTIPSDYSRQQSDIDTEKITTTDSTQSWATFKSTKYGFELNYPNTLKLQETTMPSIRGFVYCVDFTKASASIFDKYVYAGAAGCFSKDFGLGGTSSDFEAGRSGSFMDTQGYITRNGATMFKFVQAREFEIPQDLIIRKYINKNNVEIIITKGKNESNDSPFPIMGTPGDGFIGALVNTGNAELPGLGFQYSNSTTLLTEEEFYQILDSFKLENASVKQPSTQENGVELKDIKYKLPTGWRLQSTEKGLAFLPETGEGSILVQVAPYTGDTGRREYYCGVYERCIEGKTSFKEVNIGNISGYIASDLDNGDMDAEYFGVKGDKFYILLTKNSPDKNSIYNKSYQQLLDSLIF